LRPADTGLSRRLVQRDPFADMVVDVGAHPQQGTTPQSSQEPPRPIACGVHVLTLS
jgi:hypothetical protein